MNYLITGGKGFIGSHLANKLAKEKKNKVFVIDNLSNPCPNPLNNLVQTFYGDTSDFIFLKKIILSKKIQIIFHLAATINSSIKTEVPAADIQNTVSSTINILEILKIYPSIKVIFGSSVAVYGKSNGKNFNEKSNLNPEFSYSISKKTAEDYVNYYSRYYQLKTAIIRIGNVYGPYQPKIGEVGVINIFIRGLIKKEVLNIFGDRSQKRNFIFIDDVVAFLKKSIKLEGVYNLVSNHSSSIKDLLIILSKKSNKIKVKNRKRRLEEIGNIKISNKKARKTGWHIEYSIEKGINKTLNFYEKYREFL